MSKHLVKSGALGLKCTYLLFRNLLFIKMLRFNCVELYDKIVIEGNEIELLWKVKGCHRISIKGIGSFAGNIHGIKFKLVDINQPIDITFHGIERKFQKSLLVKGDKVTLINKFHTNSALPLATEVPHNSEELETSFCNEKLKTDFKYMFVEFEPFNLENYKPSNPN